MKSKKLRSKIEALRRKHAKRGKKLFPAVDEAKPKITVSQNENGAWEVLRDGAVYSSHPDNSSAWKVADRLSDNGGMDV